MRGESFTTSQNWLARSRLSKVSKILHVMSQDQKHMIKTRHCSKWLPAPLILTMDLPSGNLTT